MSNLAPQNRIYILSSHILTSLVHLFTSLTYFLHRRITSTMSYIYRIHHLPTSDPVLVPFLAGKFASLRLSALTVSALAFSSTFEYESAFAASRWISRLQRPLLHTFVAVAYAAGTPIELQTVDAGDWIGSATLLGPFTRESFEIPDSGGPEVANDGEESKWQMSAVYNSPLHRGNGIAKMLIQEAMEFANEAGMRRRSRVRIMIHPQNVLVKKRKCLSSYVSIFGCLELAHNVDHRIDNFRKFSLGTTADLYT